MNAGVLEDGKRIRVEEWNASGQGVLRRFWRTSIFITYSTCGIRACGVESERMVMSSSCATLMTSWSDSRAKAAADQFRAELTERMRKFNLELHPEKTRLLEFGPGMRSTNESGVEKGNRRRSTSSALRTSARRRGAMDGLRWCGKRYAKGCRRS